MKNIVLLDIKKTWEDLLPLTYTRPISKLKVGILNISQKWEYKLKSTISYSTIDYLSAKFPLDIGSDNIVINSQILPTDKLVVTIENLSLNEILYKDNQFIAARIDKDTLIQIDQGLLVEDLIGLTKKQTSLDYTFIHRPYDIFSFNGDEIKHDFDIVTKDKKSQNLNETNTHFGKYPIFIEEGSEINCAIFNTSDGPIYIGKNALIMEGSMIRGPFSMGENSFIKMGSKIYKNTSIADYCKIGGEVNNVVMHSYSNKGHDGYLGNAVIGEWCNLGADTNNSNLKNNYSEVKLWSYTKNGFAKTGLQFCGLIMADHSKCGINTMFNTGSVVGVSANLFGAGYQKNFVPSFTWGAPNRYMTYRLEKVFEVTKIVMKRRNKEFSGIDKKLLEDVFDLSATYRK